jgi:hypothetical protein
MAYASELAEIERRQKYADMMREQSQTPLGTQMAGRAAIPISWTQGAAKLLQGYVGGQTRDKAESDRKSLADKRGQALAAALRGMPQAKTENLNLVNVDDEGNPMPAAMRTTQPTMADNAGWLAQLAQVGPDAVAMGTGLMGMQQKADENNENRDFRREQSAQARQAAIEQLEMRLADQRLAAQDRAALQEQLAQMRIDAQRDMAQFAANNRPPPQLPPVTPVTIQDPKDPNKTIIIDGRTRAVLGAGPKLTQVGTSEQKRQFNMQGIGATIQAADDLLSGAGGRPLPTGSGIGSLYDTAAGFFGKSPEGAPEADRLRAVGGALVAKMPRMEGPQSDKDVQLYKETAGMVGDSTLPVARRKQALETVKGLWAKYERLNPDAFSGGDAGGGLPSQSEIDAEMKRRGL